MKSYHEIRAAARAERNAMIIALTKAGLSGREIAERLGISRTTVKVVQSDRAEELVQLPSWVPPYLHDDYRAIAVEDGEEAAASYVRNRKAAQVSTGSLDCRGC